MLRVSYFHNTFGRQIESVPATEVPTLLPQLSPSEQQALESLLSNAGGIDLNSQAFRAQGIESEVEYSLFKNLFMRGGYTYLDAVVSRSFTSDALKPSFNTGLPTGRRRPSRTCQSAPSIRCVEPAIQRPPHTGYAAVSYNGEQYSAGFTEPLPAGVTILLSWAAVTSQEGTRCCYPIATWTPVIPSSMLAEATSFSSTRRLCSTRQPYRQQENRSYWISIVALYLPGGFASGSGAFGE